MFVGEEGAGCFAFLWCVIGALSVMFAFPLGIIGRLCSVIVVLLVHLPYSLNRFYC